MTLYTVERRTFFPIQTFTHLIFILFLIVFYVMIIVYYR